jgi:hypothetical protein
MPQLKYLDRTYKDNEELQALMRQRVSEDLYGKPHIESDTPAMKEVREFLAESAKKHFPELLATGVTFYDPKDSRTSPVADIHIYVPAGKASQNALEAFKADLNQLQIRRADGTVYPGSDGFLEANPNFLGKGRITDVEQVFARIQLDAESLVRNLRSSRRQGQHL